jgi:hypothetical protein
MGHLEAQGSSEVDLLPLSSSTCSAARSSAGPYSGMSALLAMERLAEGWLSQGASPARVIEVLLVGCEKLAVPGMLFGLMPGTC